MCPKYSEYYNLRTLMLTMIDLEVAEEAFIELPMTNQRVPVITIIISMLSIPIYSKISTINE